MEQENIHLLVLRVSPPATDDRDWLQGKCSMTAYLVRDAMGTWAGEVWGDRASLLWGKLGGEGWNEGPRPIAREGVSTSQHSLRTPLAPAGLLHEGVLESAALTAWTGSRGSAPRAPPHPKKGVGLLFPTPSRSPNPLRVLCSGGRQHRQRPTEGEGSAVVQTYFEGWWEGASLFIHPASLRREGNTSW